MPQYVQIIIALLFLMVVFALTKYGIALKMKRAANFIIRDLKTREALDPASATPLRYEKREYFKIGTRDFKPNVLKSLVQMDIVGKTGNGRYYLKKEKPF